MSNQAQAEQATQPEELDAEKQAALAAWQGMLGDPRTKARLEADLFGTLRTLAYLLKELATSAADALADEQLAEIDCLEAEHPKLASPRPPRLRLALAAAAPREPKFTPTARHIIPAARSSLRSGAPRKTATVTAGASSSSGDPPPPSDDDPPRDHARCSDCDAHFRAAGKKLTRFKHGQDVYCNACSTDAARQRRSKAKRRKPKPKRRRLGGVAPLAHRDAEISSEYLARLARFVEIHKLLPSANGTTPKLRAELARLSRSLIDEAVRLKAEATLEGRWDDKRAVDAAWHRAAYLAGIRDGAGAGFRDVDGGWVSARMLRSIP